ncbi:MAG: hypothetical protein EOM67_16660 [Spirochaetia bacterium]|nr:hypothetical protein [Spirochaetia bacterium]
MKEFRTPTMWLVGSKLWIQVSVADRDNYEKIKRSKCARSVVESFRADGQSDETIFEMEPEAFRRLNIKAKLLKDELEEASSFKEIYQPRKRIDHSLVESAALNMKGSFNARDVVALTNASLPLVRLLLGQMVKNGQLGSNPKKGYFNLESKC